MLFMGLSRQGYWLGLPFPSPGDPVLSELPIMTHASWVALNGMAHSFIELHKAVIHVIILVSFLWLWFLFWRCGIIVLASSVCPRMHKDKRFWKLPYGRDWLWGKLALALLGRAMLKWKVSVSHSVVSDSLWPLEPTRLLYPWNSSDKNTGVDCHSFLLEIFLTQGLNLGLQHCRQILYPLNHLDSPLGAG